MAKRRVLRGPKSKWHSKKLKNNVQQDLRDINDWAKELYKWAKIITDESRLFEYSHVHQANHIPDPPPPPFDV
jgi:hypothetical protein